VTKKQITTDPVSAFPSTGLVQFGKAAYVVSVNLKAIKVIRVVNETAVTTNYASKCL
jgi:hypothetical protein